MYGFLIFLLNRFFTVVTINVCNINWVTVVIDNSFWTKSISSHGFGQIAGGSGSVLSLLLFLLIGFLHVWLRFKFLNLCLHVHWFVILSLRVNFGLSFLYTVFHEFITIIIIKIIHFSCFKLQKVCAFTIFGYLGKLVFWFNLLWLFLSLFRMMVFLQWFEIYWGNFSK